MTKKELKVEIPGKVYRREWEFWPSIESPNGGRLCIHGGWVLVVYYHNREGMRPIAQPPIFIPDPNHEWVLEPLKEEPEEETSEVMKELHKKSDEALEETRELKRNPEKTKEKTNKSWFSRLFRSNNG